MSKTIVFFYIDALDFNMLSAKFTPFLFDFTKKGYYQKLENIAGYSFGIQSCMLSGKYPEENLHWMPYFYSPQNSPMLFKALSKVRRITPLDMLPYARYGVLRILRKLFMRKGVHAYNVPLSVIGNLYLFPYYYMNELPFFQELKKLLNEKCQTELIYLGPPKVRGDVYSSLLKYIKGGTHEKTKVILVYDDVLDRIGHGFGPSSPEYVNYVRKLDKLLSNTCSEVLKIDAHAIFFFFSDHAQSQLTNCVDIISTLGKLGVKMPNEYQCFIDATVGLFWPNDTPIEERMVNILRSLKVGTLIDNRLREKYHLQFADTKMYGDLIYILRPGWTFFPNFFSPFGPMKGLHGYLPEDEVQKSFLISNKKFLLHIDHVKDIRTLLLNISC